jgi:hypothetical protein
MYPRVGGDENKRCTPPCMNEVDESFPTAVERSSILGSVAIN